MIQKYVEALKDGKILAVDWQEIDEMLGEDPNRKIKCSICDDGNCFPPIAEETHDLREEDVMEVIRQAGIRWASFDYVNGTPLSRFKTRYFAAKKPSVGQWLESPNA